MSDAKVPAADQTLQILSLLARSRGPMAASMIATHLGLPRSTTYQLLATLQEHGYVMHLPEAKRFGLGIAAVELSSAYARHEPLSRIGRPLVADLVDRMHVSGHLAVPHGRDVLYIVEERATGSPTLVSDVDVRLPMHLTASGRAVLSALPKAQVRALFPDRAAFVHRHDATVPQGDTDDARTTFVREDTVSVEGAVNHKDAVIETDTGIGPPEQTTEVPAPYLQGEIDRYSRLRSELDATRTRGFALERGSVTPGLASIGLPVQDHRGWPIAAIAVTFPEDTYDDEGLRVLATEVRRTTELLSVRIHGRSA